MIYLPERWHCHMQAQSRTMSLLLLHLLGVFVQQDLLHRRVGLCVPPIDSAGEDSPEWRARALSLIWSHLLGESNSADDKTASKLHWENQGLQESVPSLSMLCMRVLLSSTSPSEFAEQISPLIPTHLRRDLIHFCAVHAPLSNTHLYSLYQLDGHASGEFIVTGPHASVRRNHFLDSSTACLLSDEHGESWDSSTASNELTRDQLHTCIILSSHLPVSTFLVLPPTITRLALINLPNPVPLHRLPATTPLLEFLDLSFNKWLSSVNTGEEKPLEMVPWSKLSRLRILALRGCQTQPDVISTVNKGRWDDVQIIE